MVVRVAEKQTRMGVGTIFYPQLHPIIACYDSLLVNTGYGGCHKRLRGSLCEVGAAFPMQMFEAKFVAYLCFWRRC